jgi:hypothetical protein
MSVFGSGNGVVCSHQIIKYLAKHMPALSYALFDDESGKLKSLDYHKYGTISPHDIFKIAMVLRPQHFHVQ